LSKRINISYSIELSQLSDEVDRLIANSLSSLEVCVANFREEIGACNSLEMRQHEAIDAVRHSLSDVDYALSDINAIINTYNYYRLEQQAPHNQTPAELQSSETKETIDELRSLAGDLLKAKPYEVSD
tara:strand:+ start:387 stop:770 length:384 start_codon:yes stop_codon:yes gene_type:complete